jgi:flagellar protein FliJ
MKKFTFSLQTVLRIREIFKKQKQTEYSQACAELERLFSIKESLESELGKCTDAYGAAMESAMTGSQIAWYYDYTGFLKDNILSLAAPIRDAQRNKDALREQLITMTREVDALERLKKEQYHRYLCEAAKEEEKMLGDLMSYESSTRNSGPEPA